MGLLLVRITLAVRLRVSKPALLPIPGRDLVHIGQAVVSIGGVDGQECAGQQDQDEYEPLEARVRRQCLSVGAARVRHAGRAYRGAARTQGGCGEGAVWGCRDN